MQPDSQALLVVAIVVTVLAPVALSLTWSRIRGRWRVPLRTAGVILCAGAAVGASGVWVNRQVEAVTTWQRLFGQKYANAAGRHRGPRQNQDFAPMTVTSPSGSRLVTYTVPGPVSGITMPMYAYLPPGYAAHPDRRYPVIEVLHGSPGGPLFWVSQLSAPKTLDQEIVAGRMAPAVVLFPYQTPNPTLDTECTNMVHGPQAETYLTRDVPAFAAAHLRVRTEPGSWGLIGFSAGAYCASDLLLRHPGQYAAGASLSGYPGPGIAVGDGSEHTTYNELWRLTHLPQPAVALYLACSTDDKYAMSGTRKIAQLVHAPLTLSTAYIDGGGHNPRTWKAMEAPAFDWLSTYLGQPYDATPDATAAPATK